MKPKDDLSLDDLLARLEIACAKLDERSQAPSAGNRAVDDLVNAPKGKTSLCAAASAMNPAAVAAGTIAATASLPPIPATKLGNWGSGLLTACSTYLPICAAVAVSALPSKCFGVAQDGANRSAAGDRESDDDELIARLDRAADKIVRLAAPEDGRNGFEKTGKNHKKADRELARRTHSSD